MAFVSFFAMKLCKCAYDSVITNVNVKPQPPTAGAAGAVQALVEAGILSKIQDPVYKKMVESAITIQRAYRNHRILTVDIGSRLSINVQL